MVTVVICLASSLAHFSFSDESSVSGGYGLEGMMCLTSTGSRRSTWFACSSNSDATNWSLSGLQVSTRPHTATHTHTHKQPESARRQGLPPRRPTYGFFGCCSALLFGVCLCSSWF